MSPHRHSLCSQRLWVGRFSTRSGDDSTPPPQGCGEGWLLPGLEGAPPGPFVVVAAVSRSWPTLCDPMDRSTAGFPVLHHLLESIELVRPSDHLILCRPLLFCLQPYTTLKVQHSNTGDRGSEICNRRSSPLHPMTGPETCRQSQETCAAEADSPQSTWSEQERKWVEGSRAQGQRSGLTTFNMEPMG